MTMTIRKIACLALFTMTGLLQAQLNSVKSYVTDVAKNSAYPGFAVVLVENQRIVWAQGFGETTAGSQETLTADTPLAIGSMTKSFTAMALMQMVEEGLLDLDAPVVTYLPWFQTAIKSKSDHITLRMLLSNSSGLPSLDIGISSDQTDDQADTRLAQQLSAYVLNREPGSSFEYSNEGFALAGLVGAEVSGKSYKAYMQERVLQPLQMHQSSTNLDQLKAMGTTLGHYHGLEAGIPAESTLSSMAYAAAGSVMHCSAKDLGHYLIALLNQGRFKGAQVLSPKGVATLWANQIKMPENPEAEAPEYYGLGWSLSTIDGRYVVHHGGATSTMTSYTMLEPERRTAVAVITNIPALDGYRNTRLRTIANNMLHLYHGEPLSNYGKPKEKDFTVNDFKLEPNQDQLYLGTYVAEGLSNYAVQVYKDDQGRMLVRETSGQELTGASLVDFMNPSRVVLRSIGSRKMGQFKLDLQGQVYGLTLGGAQLYKRTSANTSDAGVPVENKFLAFHLPSDWEVTQSGKEITAQSRASGTLQFRAFFSPTHEPQITPEVLFSNQTIQFEGPAHHETLKPYTWRQQSFVTQTAGQKRSFLWLSTETAQGSIHLLFSAPTGEFTKQIQQVVFPLLKSINLKNPHV